jgi:hypothetical protein
MNPRRSALLGVFLLWSLGSAASAQTVLFDFESGAQGWGSFGAITTDSGLQPFDGSVGQGRFHVGDFSQPDEGNFGIVDVSPLGLDLSPYGGLAVDARFRDVFGFDPFEGVKELNVAVATGMGASEEEFFAPVAIMTSEYETLSFLFSEFRSTLTDAPPSLADLSNIRIKLVVYNTSGIGIGRLDYDEIIGLPPVVENADFDGDGDVDGKDFLTVQRGYGGNGSQAQGDANQSGIVNDRDVTIWESQFGSVGGAATIAIPEPHGLLLLMLATACRCPTPRAAREAAA